jgi:predicted phosphodiesterase
MKETIALFGGVYSNHLALAALLEDAPRRGAQRLYCLGDLGAFGPHPDKVFPLLRAADVQVVQGNYDNSLGYGLADCQCGYTDPRDNYFARLSYDYTFENTAAENKLWMRGLPNEIRFEWNKLRVLLCHGSPRKMNEFLWQTSTSVAFLEHLCESYRADVIVVTHTGLYWHRHLPSGRHFINCGAIGRPANDGRANVWYTLLSMDEEGEPKVDFVPLAYDHAQLAAEMRVERLPEEFVETIESGWWTTCLEVLPMKERARGLF